MRHESSPHTILDALIRPLAQTLRASVVRVVDPQSIAFGATGVAPVDEALRRWAAAPIAAHAVTTKSENWQIAMAATRRPVKSAAGSGGFRAGGGAMAEGSPALVIVARQYEPWEATELELLENFVVLEGGDQDASCSREQRAALDDVVIRIAVALMSVSGATFAAALAQTCREVNEFFAVDTAFIRRHDQQAGLSILVAEWPPRPNVPDPDPLGAVPFDADPSFAASRHLTEPLVVRPTPDADAYQERVHQGSGIPEVALATVPLLAEGSTIGILGLIKFGDREWGPHELNALKAIASLLVQVFARVNAEDRLQHQALHDELTGLANRRHLIEHLNRRLENAGDRSLAVILLDIDRFKSTNDTLGHPVGDRLLRQVAKRLSTLSRTSDFVARLGGDEFVMVPNGPTDQEQALKLANRIAERMAVPHHLDGHYLAHSASVGVATVIEGSATAEGLISQADVALRAAKAVGGNQVQIFDDQLRRSIAERSDMEFLLRDAIDTDDVLVHYQPEFDLRTGNIVGAEALVRWRHPTRGLLAAGEFIDVAEESNLVVDIGRKVLLEATRQMAAWKPYWAGRPFVVRVNVSPTQLSSIEFVDLVRFALISNGLPGEALCLEITEHAMMVGVDRSADVLRDLRNLGVLLAIDDFGTGFSSLSRLKGLPVTTLKIDRAFVTGLDTDRSNMAIVQSMVQLAGTFNLEIVAEGVERPEEARELLRLGARRVQGFLFSRPKPPEEVVEYFTTPASVPYQLVV